MKCFVSSVLLGCVLFQVVHGISKSKSCTYVNGVMRCEEKVDPTGNSAGAMAGAAMGPSIPPSSYRGVSTGNTDRGTYSSHSSASGIFTDPHTRSDGASSSDSENSRSGSSDSGTYSSSSSSSSGEGNEFDFAHFGFPGFGPAFAGVFPGAGGAFAGAGRAFPGAGGAFAGAGGAFAGAGGAFAGAGTGMFFRKKR